MAVAAAGPLLTGIVNATAKILEFGDRYCQANSAEEELPRLVESLKNKDKQLKELKYGLTGDETLVKSLREAERLLEQEVKELSKGKGKKNMLEAVFPSLIGQSIKIAIQAFDDILKNFEDEHKLRLGVQRKVLAGKRTLDFSHHDTRYVRLEETERRVKTALLNPNGQTVTMLHGGSGKGKSTLARDIAQQIQSGNGDQTQVGPDDVDVEPTGNRGKAKHLLTRIRNLSRNATREVAATDMRVNGQTSPWVFNSHKVESGPTELSEKFDKVVFLDCGMVSEGGIVQRKLEIVQRELLKELGWVEGDGGTESSDLRVSLQGLLKESKVLIILDNVWNSEFLGTMVLLTEKALNVKWLVTTQDGKLCDSLNFCPTKISMEKANVEGARKIFARQIMRSEDGQTIDTIPPQTQGIADELIRKVDTNLLAIACLATGVDPKKIGDVKEWEDARRDFYRLLSSKEAAIFNVKYPGSYWAALQFSFERLDEGAKRLLFLIGLCEATSVPKLVLEYLYGRMIQSSMKFPAFKSAMRDLEAKDLVVHLRFDDDCSIHDLARKFVNDHEINRHYRNSMLAELSRLSLVSGSAEDLDACSVLLFMYFKRSLVAAEIDFDVGISMDDSIRQERRLSAEELTSLMVRSEIETPTTDFSRYVRQMLLTYMKEGRFDNNLYEVTMKSIPESPEKAMWTLSLERVNILQVDVMLHNLFRELIRVRKYFFREVRTLLELLEFLNRRYSMD